MTEKAHTHVYDVRGISQIVWYRVHEIENGNFSECEKRFRAVAAWIIENKFLLTSRKTETIFFPSLLSYSNQFDDDMTVILLLKKNVIKVCKSWEREKAEKSGIDARFNGLPLSNIQLWIYLFIAKNEIYIGWHLIYNFDRKQNGK